MCFSVKRSLLANVTLGRPINICSSNRPGRSSAASTTSIRFVAATTSTSPDAAHCTINCSGHVKGLEENLQVQGFELPADARSIPSISFNRVVRSRCCMPAPEHRNHIDHNTVDQQLRVRTSRAIPTRISGVHQGIDLVEENHRRGRASRLRACHTEPAHGELLDCIFQVIEAVLSAARIVCA
jgi:hypothetical protein